MEENASPRLCTEGLRQSGEPGSSDQEARKVDVRNS